MPIAFRLVQRVCPDDEASAVERWRAAASALLGESSEIRAVLAGARHTGALTESELLELGLEPSHPAVIDRSRVLVLRRHAEPDVSGRIGTAGLAACSQLASVCPTPAWSSDVIRAVQTAVALGGDGVKVTALLRPPPTELERFVGAHLTFRAWAAAAERDLAVRGYCDSLAQGVLGLVGHGETVMIGHDDTIQAVAVGILGREAADLGRNIGHLEGVAISISSVPQAVRLGAPP